MKAKDDLTKLCDELEYCACNKRCYCNEIVCTKRVLKDYAQDDINKVKKIKAQLEIHDKVSNVENGSISLTIAVLALALAIAVEVISDINFLFLLAFGTLVLSIYTLVNNMWCNHKDTNRRKWREYIRACLDDIEEEIRKK